MPDFDGILSSLVHTNSLFRIWKNSLVFQKEETISKLIFIFFRAAFLHLHFPPGAYVKDPTRRTGCERQRYLSQLFPSRLFTILAGLSVLTRLRQYSTQYHPKHLRSTRRLAVLQKFSKRNFGFTRSPTTDNHHFLASKSLNHWSIRQTTQIRTPLQFSTSKWPCHFWPESYHMRAKTGPNFCIKMELSFLFVSILRK